MAYYSFDGTWLSNFDYQKMDDKELYNLAIYWAVQTFTTVGYGDVGGKNSTERLFGSAMMVIGVLAFSFANGSFASIIQNYDAQNSQLLEKSATLNKIYLDFKLPLDLYVRIKKAVGYESKKDI